MAQPSPDQIPASVVTMLQEALAEKITEMVLAHRELLTEMVRKDQERELRVRRILTHIERVRGENATLALENQKLKDILACRLN